MPLRAWKVIVPDEFPETIGLSGSLAEKLIVEGVALELVIDAVGPCATRGSVVHVTRIIKAASLPLIIAFLSPAFNQVDEMVKVTEAE